MDNNLRHRFGINPRRLGASTLAAMVMGLLPVGTRYRWNVWTPRERAQIEAIRVERRALRKEKWADPVYRNERKRAKARRRARKLRRGW